MKKLLESWDRFLNEENLNEKDDRCTRIAKRKYDVWPSAYASGAVVKCRQGKIWKDVKENIEDAALAENTEYEDLLEEVEILDEKKSLSERKLAPSQVKKAL